MSLVQMKLKDATLQRLQTSLRECINHDQKITEKITAIEEKQSSIINKLEDAVCFGKVLFVMQPIIDQSQRSIE